jgi:hypothetical protein
MTRCIDLFIDATEPLDALAAALGQLTGVTFVGPVEGSHWALSDGPATALLAEHDFADDRHLLLTRYRYDLSSRVNTVNFADSAEVTLLRRVFAAVRADGRYPALLVFDLQHVLDRTDVHCPPEATQ